MRPDQDVGTHSKALRMVIAGNRSMFMCIDPYIPFQCTLGVLGDSVTTPDMHCRQVMWTTTPTSKQTPGPYIVRCSYSQ